MEGAREEGDCEGVVVRHVELEEARAGGVGFGDGFDGGGARGGEGVGEVEFVGDLLVMVLIEVMGGDRGLVGWEGRWEGGVLLRREARRGDGRSC